MWDVRDLAVPSRLSRRSVPDAPRPSGSVPSGAEEARVASVRIPFRREGDQRRNTSKRPRTTSTPYSLSIENLFVRTDLGMTSGKIAAQCSHAALACFEQFRRSTKGLVKVPRLRMIRVLLSGQQRRGLTRSGRSRSTRSRRCTVTLGSRSRIE